MKMITLISAMALCLAACGQKGPLYLPEQNAPVQQPTPQPQGGQQ